MRHKLYIIHIICQGFRFEQNFVLKALIVITTKVFAVFLYLSDSQSEILADFRGESICRLSWKVFADFRGNNARISLWKSILIGLSKRKPAKTLEIITIKTFNTKFCIVIILKVLADFRGESICRLSSKVFADFGGHNYTDSPLWSDWDNLSHFFILVECFLFLDIKSRASVWIIVLNRTDSSKI